MKKIFLQTIFVSIGIFKLDTLYAQSLNLFQETDNPQREVEQTRTTQRNRDVNTDPAFTLVGTSRFGEKYFASLLSRDETSILVEWTPGKVVSIDGYRDYGLANVGSRTASIRIPSGINCIENNEKGVRCNGNIAILSLSNGKPLENNDLNTTEIDEVSNNEDAIVLNNNETVIEDESSNTIPGTNVLRRNPFSGELQTLPELSEEQRLAREQRRAERAEQFRNFEIVRIPDDEIPEGMRRVRTPFGDSLEPIED